VFYGDEACAHHLRRCFSGRPLEQLEEGVKRFAKALAACCAVGTQPEVITVAMV